MTSPRSYLFVPADRPERFAKALASGADAVIVDLEDAVAPAAKGGARDGLARWLHSIDGGAATLLVRINPPGTEWFDADLALLRAAPPRTVTALMLPKAERASELEHAHRVSGGLPLLPLIESAEGFDHLRDLMRAPGVQRLAFGSIDFQLDMGIDESEAGTELLFFRSQLVLASRLAAIAPPIDGVTTAIDDAERLKRDAAAARRLGFGAKLCIHPKQVAAVHAAFTPSAAEIDWARRVLDAMQRAGGAAVVVDGKMVDRPVELRARQVLSFASDRAPLHANR
jgi:citrate lyase subunit beta / citryl-CoA lyase